MSRVEGRTEKRVFFQPEPAWPDGPVAWHEPGSAIKPLYAGQLFMQGGLAGVRRSGQGPLRSKQLVM